MNPELVLVTGGAGYVATFCLIELLQRGYLVRTTVRSLSRADEVRAALKEGGVTDTSNLTFVEADLLNDNNWAAAAAGCDYVLHVASPLQLAHPKDENELIRPAVEGTQRLLRFARDGGVKRVVITSNFGAVGYGHHERGTLITEESWTDPNQRGLSPYNKSKVLAERSAWDFMKKEGGKLQLAVVNPVGVFGPALSAKLSGGHHLLLAPLNGTMPAVPDMELAIVDVRDLAVLHVLAMTVPEAAGQRFLGLSDGTMTLLEIAKFFKRERPALTEKAATKPLPTWQLRLAALFNPRAKGLLQLTGVNRAASNEKAKKVLGWKPRPKEEVLLATIDTLEKFGALKAGAK